MNVHDSEKIAGIFTESGYGQAEDMKDADVIVINTCSIRQKAEQKVYSELGRLKSAKKNNPHLKIAVAGCIAQQKGNTLFKKFPYVDFLFGPGNIDSLQKWIPVPSGTGHSPEPFDAGQACKTHITALNDNPEYHTKTLPIKREGQVRAWVSIMYGCNNFCAYCVVPYTRGRERSRPSKDICSEIQNLAEQGYKEITLLGQNVNSYGKYLSESIDFPDLLKVIHDVTGIERIRFVTSHPRDLSQKLIETLRDLPSLCEHIHLPVQSGSDKILSLMNRGYTYKQYSEKIEMMRSMIPGIAITSDIIVGFPGETDEDFQHTMNALKEIEFDGIFAFKYSKRPDTAALSLPVHIDESVKSQRLSMVLDLQEHLTYKKNKALEGKILEVLVEGPSETDSDKLTGRTRSNKIVNFYAENKSSNRSNRSSSSSSLIGRLIQLKILEAKQHSLLGEVV
ncbi:MAG: tRNA (N6-isopentenyl adenosine(37)-C2)-methylthiotransferase MiaB [Thermodesulfovibrionia bacterium]|nr:tRNA (N6-isopentenyl adenosine(37)-C2)-methylthiotransferase MiaB [Thermodesulfovibrionia bacterium]